VRPVVQKYVQWPCFGSGSVEPFGLTVGEFVIFTIQSAILGRLRGVQDGWRKQYICIEHLWGIPFEKFFLGYRLSKTIGKRILRK
jgi:hypothetical protein